MLLELDADVFASYDGKESTQALRLFFLIYDGRHSWYPPPHLWEVATRYLEKLIPTMKICHEFVRNASTASAWQSAGRRPTVRVTAESLERVAEDLGKPAIVIVENSRNDGSFLKAVFAAYEPALAEAIRRDWLQIDHSGGTGEQAHLADEQAKKFVEVCRIIVIKDNDKGLTITTPANESEVWPPSKPHVHMWHRLEIENYLPDAVLMQSTHPDALSLISHLRSMTAEQQRLIDMKKGLKNAQKELFRGLGPDCKKVWHDGFAKTFPSPLVPETVTLTVDDFRKLGDDVHEELTQLLTRIRDLT